MLGRLRRLYHRQQYHPGLLGMLVNPFYFARGELRRAFAELGPQIGGRTLDVGCGQKPYRELFRSAEYVGLEFDTPDNRKFKTADFYYDGQVFPFRDGEFDSVVCTQVLEHVFTPGSFLSEIHRVMRPGGVMLLSVPFVWDEHEQPYDCARYSSFGLKRLLERTGFEVVEHRKSLGDVRVLFQLLNAYTFKKTQTRSGWVNLFLTVLLISPVNILGVAAGWLLPANQDLYLDNVVLARKRATR